MAHQDYFVNGEKVASVTTILGRWKDSGGLIYWAWKEGKEGRDFRETRDKAADAGTLAHRMLEADIRRKPAPEIPPDKEVYRQAAHAFQAYFEWKQSSTVTIIRTEVPLTSKIHNFGGTLDAIRVGESRRLTDWKTSSGVYTEMLLQVAGGYSLLWEENYPDEPLDGIEILRFSKPEQPDDPVSFTHHYWGKAVIPIAQRQFLLLKDAYYLDKRLKALL